MKKTIKCVGNLSLVLLVANAIALAQTSNRSSNVKARTETEELRVQELRAFRDHVLTRTLDSIKKMDEPGLRLSARNQVLVFLSTTKISSGQSQELATQIALDALADFREHGEALLPFMATYLANDLGGWIEKYQPSLKDNYDKSVKPSLKTDPTQRIRSVFELEDGDILAAQQIRQLLADDGPLDGIQFWLDELMRTRSKEFQPLASEIVVRAAQGQISFQTLFWISDTYLRSEMPVTLRNRFLATVVARTHPVNFATEPAPEIAYQLLTNILPFVAQAAPDLYEQALSHNLAIRASLSERQLVSEARNKRIKESLNPIEDLMSEARTTKSGVERNELFLQASQMALEKSRLELCLNIITEIDINEKGADVAHWQRSIDQITKGVVKSAIASKQPELAEKAAARIRSTLSKVEAYYVIMRYWLKTNDAQTAQRLLSEASKAADSAVNDIEKAKAFLFLCSNCDDVDEALKGELFLSGIKALNNIPKPESNGDTKNITYQTYVRDLDNVGHELTKSFKSLTKRDRNTALALVEKLQRPDLRTLSLIGILQATDELLNKPPAPKP